MSTFEKNRSVSPTVKKPENEEGRKSRQSNRVGGNSSQNSESKVDDQINKLKIDDFKNSNTSSEADAVSPSPSPKNRGGLIKVENEKEQSIESGVSSEAPPENAN